MGMSSNGRDTRQALLDMLLQELTSLLYYAGYKEGHR